MAAEDWVDFGVEFDDFDFDGTVTCKYCGAGYLFWEEARGERNEKRWVLVTSQGKIHSCPKRPGPAAIDEFEVEV